MGYMDELEDELSNLRGKLLYAINADDFKDLYLQFKHVLIDIQKEHWSSVAKDFNSLKEGHFYYILGRYIDFDDTTGEVTDEMLARLLKLDPQLKQYCIDHIEHDGIVGLLKYKSIPHKKELIAKALLLT